MYFISAFAAYAEDCRVIRVGYFDDISFARQVNVSALGMDIILSDGVYPVDKAENLPINVLCDRTDMADSSQRADGEYIRYYSDDERQRLLSERVIEEEMENSLAEHQFYIEIQPKYDIDTDRLVGGEALVRWKHPKYGQISPAEFINFFEGSGYSSLNMLNEMLLDVIKMDLRFMSGHEDEVQAEKGLNILRTMIELAHTLELDVVVEGVETAEQRDFLRQIGGCTGQGYFYSKPVACSVFEQLLYEQHSQNQ